jgi:hypothetical protein
MMCAQCGTVLSAEVAGCPRCGTAAPAPSQVKVQVQVAEPAGSSRTGGQSFRLDLTRLAGADPITGISTLVLLISLFLPWYGVSVLGFGVQVDGLTGHGYLYLVLLMCLAIEAYLVFSAGYEQPPFRLPLSHQQRLLIATGINAVLVLLAFLVKPGDSGWRFGAFAGILAALVALAPLAVPALRARRAHG